MCRATLEFADDVGVDESMRLALVVPIHNRIRYTRPFVESLFESRYANFTLFIVDDGSTDGSGDYLRRNWPQVRIIEGDGNLYWTKAANEGIRAARADGSYDCVVTLNDDVTIPPDFLANLVAALRQHPHAVIGSQCCDKHTGRWDNSGFRRNWLIARNEPIPFDPDTDVSTVTHVCARGTAYPMRLFDEVGLFDERWLRMGGDDDLTFRAARAGWDILVCNRARHYCHIDATPTHDYLQRFSLGNFRRYLFGMKSPCRLTKRFLTTYRHCRPRWYWPISLLLDVTRVVGGYFRRTLFATGLSHLRASTQPPESKP